MCVISMSGTKRKMIEKKSTVIIVVKGSIGIFWNKVPFSFSLFLSLSAQVNLYSCRESIAFVGDDVKRNMNTRRMTGEKERYSLKEF